GGERTRQPFQSRRGARGGGSGSLVHAWWCNKPRIYRRRFTVPGAGCAAPADARGNRCDGRYGREIPGRRTRYYDSVVRPFTRYRLCLRRSAFERCHHPSTPEAGPGGSSRAFPQLQIRMDLHVYRTSQDRWHDLSAAARERGAVLAVNAVTFHELVQRLTPDVATATVGQRLAVLGTRAGENGPWTMEHVPWSISSTPRYLYDAITELKSSRVRPHELRSAGADFLADILERYDDSLRQAGIYDPQDRCALAAARVK